MDGEGETLCFLVDWPLGHKAPSLDSPTTILSIELTKGSINGGVNR